MVTKRTQLDSDCDKLDQAEKDWISKQKETCEIEGHPLVNSTNGGREGFIGCIFKAETRLKMSIAHKGKSPWNKGLTKENNEIMAQISNNKKGKLLSAEHKRKISESSKIAQNKPEIKKANSDAQKIAQNRLEVKIKRSISCSKALKNKKKTQEHIENLRKSLLKTDKNKGKNNPNYHRSPKDRLSSEKYLQWKNNLKGYKNSVVITYFKKIFLDWA